MRRPADPGRLDPHRTRSDGLNWLLDESAAPIRSACTAVGISPCPDTMSIGAGQVRSVSCPRNVQSRYSGRHRSRRMQAGEARRDFASGASPSAKENRLIARFLENDPQHRARRQIVSRMNISFSVIVVAFSVQTATAMRRTRWQEKRKSPRRFATN